MSSNLHSLLKNQIREAIAHLYDAQSTSAANRYSHPDEFSKALLDILFPAEPEENTTVTGVVKVPTIDEPTESESDSSSKKERKKRGPMSDEAKAAMKAKREATVAAKKAADVPAPVVVPVVVPAPAAPEPEETKDKKDRKPRGPMSDEAKANMKAKREATLAAKKAAQA
jgi:hypothetical protein